MDRQESVDIVRRYLDEIGEPRLLDRNDEIRLAQLIETGRCTQARLDAGEMSTLTDRRRLVREVADGRRAHQQFVEANLRLVVAVARRYRRPGVELLDLVQAGNLGLMRAVQGFDWRLGNKFSTYAIWWIRQAVVREMGETSRVVRLPANVLDDIAALHQTKDRIRVELGHEPTVEELAEETGAAPERVRNLFAIGRDAVSLSLPVGDSDTAELAGLIADERDADPGERAAGEAERREIRHLMDHLSDHEAAVLRLRYGFDGGEQLSLDDVGRRLGVSRERARQLETKALCHLRFDDAAQNLGKQTLRKAS
jgi:RNA polymerase primary sigma factor